MLVRHKLSGSVYYLDEFLDGVRIRNYRTGEVRNLPEEKFKKFYELVEEDFPLKSDSQVSVVDDILKEMSPKKKKGKKKKKKIKTVPSTKPKKVVTKTKKKEAPKKIKKVKVKRKLK